MAQPVEEELRTLLFFFVQLSLLFTQTFWIPALRRDQRHIDVIQPQRLTVLQPQAEEVDFRALATQPVSIAG